MRAATRASELARWQTDYVAGLIAATAPTTAVDAVVVSTQGDVDKTSPIAAIGGKGVFVKEVQNAVLEGRADIAVHSAKDLPAVTPDGLLLAAIPIRADPRDVLVGAGIDDLEPGMRVGTGSNRRRTQLLDMRPGIECVEIRGNIGTRLERVGELDAIIMAAAALDRLGILRDDVHPLEALDMIPQVGQGALAVECRSADDRLIELLESIESTDDRRAVDAERAFLAELGGDCTLPAGAYARIVDGDVHVRAMLASEGDAPAIVRDARSGSDGVALGRAVAADLRQRLES